MSRSSWVVLWGVLLSVLVPEAGQAVPPRFVRPAPVAPQVAPPGGLVPGAPGAPGVPGLGRPGLLLPEPLKPWVPWVLHGREGALCPPLLGKQADSEEGDDSASAPCAWPGRLALLLRDKGGTFTQSFRTYKRGLVDLPGDGKIWPQEVRVDGLPAVVIGTGDDEDAAPRVLLTAGEHTVTGTFLWDELPESLPVPEETGLLSLAVRGQNVLQPQRDAEGRVFLQKQGTAVEEDVLEIDVGRKVTDEIPLRLTTRIELRVSGKSREVALGRTLPGGFVPMALDSPLPARLEADSRLRVQVRPGTYVLTLEARHDGLAGRSGPGPVEMVSELVRPEPKGMWAESEVWAFDARPQLRIVTIEGVAAIDPQQTTLPDDWKKLPCYPLKAGEALKLSMQRRGDSEPVPDRLILNRNLYLDFDGQGLTVVDRIRGSLSRGWRLEVNPPMELGRVATQNKDQLITRGETGRSGVELRQGRVVLDADSRIQREGSLPAVGWDADFHQVSATLHLPPGWRLFRASGADDVPGTWIRHYTLLDLFLVVVVAMAVARLFGLRWAALSLCGLLIACPERDAPLWAFPILLGTEALYRLLPGPRLRGLAGGLRLVGRVVLVLCVVLFVAKQIRIGLHPALERPEGAQVEDVLYEAPGSEVPGWMIGSATGGGGAGEDSPVGNIGTYGRGGLANDDEESRRSGNQDKKVLEQQSESGARKMMLKKPMAKMEMDQAAPLNEPQAPMPQQQVYGGGKFGMSNSNSVAWSKQLRARKNAFENDPRAVVQTGPGRPRWQWHRNEIKWSGPVDRGQTLELTLMSPLVNRLLAFLQVLLLGLLTARLCGLSRESIGLGLPGRAVRGGAALLAVLWLAGASLLPRTARADEPPPQEILDELKRRLLEPPECRPHCAASPRLSLTVRPRELEARLEVGSAAATAVPLPGALLQWLPDEVTLDGRPATALRLFEGHLWLVVPEGSHQIVLRGRLPVRDTVQLQLPLRPHRVEARVEGWRLEGLHEDGIADENLQLTRLPGGPGAPGSGAERDKGEGPQALQQGSLPPLVRVEREIQIGLQWQVDTRVVRETPTGSAVVIEVPLLPGESITTAEVRVQNGKALVNMSPTTTEVSWHSLLSERPKLDLTAARVPSLTEVWRLSVSPMFHVEFDAASIPAVHQQDEGGTRLPEWRPLPGEQVGVRISRPEGTAGRTLTIDQACLVARPGLRTTDATLAVKMRSSRGGQHSFTLPEGSQVLSVKVNDKSQPTQRSGRSLVVSLNPGGQSVEVQWRQPGGVGFLYRSPEVDLGAPAVNVEVRLEIGSGRWVLQCGGPRLGPAVLFWSHLLFLVLLSLGLSRIRFVPLRAQHYLLLGIGLTQVSVLSAALVVGWLLLLGWRAERPEVQSRVLFNLRQLLILAWTVAAFMVLFEAVRAGLNGHPDMQITGNGSHGGLGATLQWFTDRTSGKVPRTSVISAPMEAYRVAMLLWAVWLAVALLGWLRWGYAAFAHTGLWRPAPPKPPKAATSVRGKDAGKESGKGDKADPAEPDAAASERTPKSAG
ncbi:MAG: hypothetical protein U1A78_24800 [Polyangia bacterium]